MGQFQQYRDFCEQVGAPIGFDAYRIVEGADLGFTCNDDVASNRLRALRWAGCASVRRQSKIVRLLVLVEFLPQGWIPNATFDDWDRTTEDPRSPDGPDGGRSVSAVLS
jgi:hypothetical protein